MDKVYIEVMVPALDRRYEFIVPSVMKTDVAADLIAQAVEEMEGASGLRGRAVLCSLDDEKMLRKGSSIEKAGIKDGCRLILV